MRLGKLPLALVALIAWAAPEVGVAAETLKVGGTGGAVRSMKVLADAFEKSHPGVTVQAVPGLGSRGGKRAVLDGAIHFAVSADPVSADEREQGLTGVELVRTPFVFATSHQGAPSNLTLQQLTDIYAGRMTSWPDGTRLRLILRPKGDSDIRHLRRISPAMDKAVDDALARPGIKVAAADQDAVDAIRTTPGGFGATTLTLLLTEDRPLKVFSLNGVAPSAKTIAAGTYPHFKSFYLVTKGAPSGSTKAFVDFARSARGGEMLSRLGHWVLPPGGAD